MHNLCFEQKYEKYQNFLSENFPFLFVKFSLYLNGHIFVMCLYQFIPFSRQGPIINVNMLMRPAKDKPAFSCIQTARYLTTGSLPVCTRTMVVFPSSMH